MRSPIADGVHEIGRRRAKGRSRKGRSMRRVAGLLAGIALAGFVQAAGGNISLSVRYADIAEVFEMLSREGKANILLSSDVTGEVSVNLYDVTLDQAVRTVAAAAGYAVEHDEDTYYVVSREEAGKDIAGGLTAIRSFKIQYSDAELVAGILENHLSRYGKITSLPERKLLIVEDLPDFLERVDVLLAELDRQPIQILIEARILEISLDASDTYGVDWRKLFPSDGGSGVLGVQGFASTTAPGLFFSLFNSNIEAVLNALNTKGRVQTLSTPKLLALEHEEAEVVIGDEIGYRVTTTINQISTESVEFLETGVIMRVSSYVDRDGRIMMDIHPEVSSGTLSLDGVPSKRSTEVTTQLLAEDGQTIFIGGLIRNTAQKRREGVPFLGDVPVLGKLFSNGEELLLKTETVVLITPHIIRPGGIADTGPAERRRVDGLGERLERLSEDEDARLGRRDPGAGDGSSPGATPRGPAREGGRPQADEADADAEYAAARAPEPAADCSQRGPAVMVGDCSPPVSFNAAKFFKSFR